MTHAITTCPRCSGALGPTDFCEEAQVYRCSNCGGLFSSSEGYEALLRTDGSESLDIKIRNTDESSFVDKMRCANCGEAMATYRYDPQPHIKIDRCVNCFSVFLDAGELKDMKRYTLLDWFRDLPHDGNPLTRAYNGAPRRGAGEAGKGSFCRQGRGRRTPSCRSAGPAAARLCPQTALHQ